MLLQITDCIQELYPAKKISYYKHDCLKIQQDRKYTYNGTLGRFRIRSVGVEKQYVLHILGAYL